MTALLLFALAACDGLRSTPAYTGTIEVTEVEVASAVGGRLVDVHFDEGERVAAGDLVITIDADAIEAERDVRASGIEVAKAAIEAANAQVKAADAQVALLEREAARVKKMEEAGVGSTQARSTTEGQLAVARAQAAAARQQVVQATASEAQATAALRVAEQHLEEASVHSVLGGVVLSRNREPGEIVGPGTSVVTLGDLDRPRLRVYVPLAVVETLTVGAPVSVRIDSSETPFPGHVSRIAKEAEFTPRDILTPEERVKRVFAVEISLEPAPGLLPGVPAEAEFGS